RETHYNFLRQYTADGTAALDPRSFPPTTLVQGTIHLSATLRGMADQVFGNKAQAGNLFLVRIDDVGASPAFRKWAELRIRQELQPENWQELQSEIYRLLEQFPLTGGIRVRDPKAFAEALPKIAEPLWSDSSQRERLKPYKGVTIFRVKPTENLVVYHALVDDIWYVG